MKTFLIRSGEGRVCFSALPMRLHGQADAKGRVWNMLMPADATKYRGDLGPDGKLDFTPDYLATMLRNFKAERAAYAELNGGSDEGFGKPITITHVGRHQGDPTSKRAVGFIEDMKLEADGLYGLTKWNDEGRELVKGDKFRFLSPEWFRDGFDVNSGETVGPLFDGVALLNDPLFFEMPRVAAAAQSHPADRPPPGATKMEKTELAKQLGLPESASDADIKAAIEAGKAAKLAVERNRNEAITASASLDTVKAEKTVLEQRAIAAEKRATELQTKLDAEATAKVETEANALVAELLTAGKIEASAQAEVKESVQKLGAEKVRKMFKATPAVVAVKATGVAGDPNPPNPAVDGIAFRTELDKHIKAGKTTAQAYELVTAENPDLVKRVAKQIPSRRPARDE